MDQYLLHPDRYFASDDSTLLKSEWPNIFICYGHILHNCPFTHHILVESDCVSVCQYDWLNKEISKDYLGLYLRTKNRFTNSNLALRNSWSKPGRVYHRSFKGRKFLIATTKFDYYKTSELPGLRQLDHSIIETRGQRHIWYKDILTKIAHSTSIKNVALVGNYADTFESCAYKLDFFWDNLCRDRQDLKLFIYY